MNFRGACFYIVLALPISSAWSACNDELYQTHIERSSISASPRICSAPLIRLDIDVKDEFEFERNVGGLWLFVADSKGELITQIRLEHFAPGKTYYACLSRNYLVNSHIKIFWPKKTLEAHRKEGNTVVSNKISAVEGKCYLREILDHD